MSLARGTASFEILSRREAIAGQSRLHIAPPTTPPPQVVVMLVMVGKITMQRDACSPTVLDLRRASKCFGEHHIPPQRDHIRSGLSLRMTSSSMLFLYHFQMVQKNIISFCSTLLLSLFNFVCTHSLAFLSSSSPALPPFDSSPVRPEPPHLPHTSGPSPILC